MSLYEDSHERKLNLGSLKAKFKKMPKWTLTLVVIMIAACLIGLTTVYAITHIYPPSNTKTGTVNPTPSPSPSPSPTPSPITVSTNLDLAPVTITVGSSWTLTAVLSNGQSGVTVNFYENTVSPSNLVGSATTDATGTATLTISPGVGSHTYIAQPQGS